MTSPELNIKPAKQIPWYLQIKDNIIYSKRIIDELSIKEINQMYKSKKFLCDDCGKELEKSDIPMDDHISHLINPRVIWSCEDCIIQCMKNGNVIASNEPEPESWQTENT